MRTLQFFSLRVRFAVRRFRCAPPLMSTRKDTTIYTDASAKVTFTQKWTPAGTRLYYATFAGATRYMTVYERSRDDHRSLIQTRKLGRGSATQGGKRNLTVLKMRSVLVNFWSTFGHFLAQSLIRIGPDR